MTLLLVLPLQQRTISFTQSAWCSSDANCNSSRTRQIITVLQIDINLA